MKKKLLMAVLCITMLGSMLGGCKKEEAADTESVVEAKTEETEEVVTREGEARSFLTGEWIDEELAAKRPVAMMVENTSATLPQYGISRADIIYECPVEGGITRLMAIFQDYSGMDKIGNVRSCRPYYIFFAKEFNAIYMHAGASVQGDEFLNTGIIDHIDGTTGAGGASYYRDDSRKAPHNLYTSSEMIDSGIAALGCDTNMDASYTGHYLFAEDDSPVELSDGTDAAVVSLYFVNPSPWFEYNEEDGLYYRYEFGEKQVDAMNDEQLAVKNIIIQECNSSMYDETAGTLNIDYMSGGNGKFITNGKCIDITWKRDSENGPTHYYDLSGNEITLNQGKTWVAVTESKYTERNHIYSTKEEFESR